MHKLSDDRSANQRRKFIGNILKAAGATALLSGIDIGKLNAQAITKEYILQDVMDIILKEIPGAPFSQTVDTLKSGKADQKVTGIITTMFATVDIIKQAARLNANFIIAHEPTFYNHTDDVNWVTDDKVVKAKLDLLNQHKIAVWRFHDYWHSHRPDGILYGVLKKAGWEKYYQDGERTINIPAMTVKAIAEHLKKSLSIEQVRIIGDLSLNCKKIGLMPGAAGGSRQVDYVERNNPDLLIVGETPEWETAEYFRDKVALGNKQALIVLGHSVSEEPGMEWLVDWLQPKIPEIKVTHIASKSPFQWV
ncbi:MAG: Nif3-like dinuclear metal center hexameric protein [Chitinophagaceae bacterium]